MKLNKSALKEMIYEVLVETNGGVMGAQDLGSQALTKGMRSSEAAKEVSALSPRERKVIAALRQAQTAMAQKGDQASSKLVRLVQMMMDELGSPTDDTDEGV